MSFGEKVIYFNQVSDWFTALLIAFVVLGVLWFLRKFVVQRLCKFVMKTETLIDDLIAQILNKTKLPLMIILAVYAGSLYLALPETMTSWINTIAVITLLVQATLWADEIILFWIKLYQRKHMAEDADRVTTARAISFFARLLLYSLLVLLVLDNIPGVEVTTLIASLGIGGIAVALAVQSILADLFASFTIALDKPFVIGDFIIIGDYMGVVEHIGLKTTRIRSLSGELIVVPNNDLLNSRIKNYKHMNERRAVFAVQVTYDTPAEQLEAIPAMIQEIVEGQEATRFDRAHLKSLGDSGLVFETVFYMVEPDFNQFMDVQQAINLAIYRAFEEKGIDFAYPTQTLHVESVNEPARTVARKKTASAGASKKKTAAAAAKKGSKTGGTKKKSARKATKKS